MSLTQLQHLKRWHAGHRATHGVEAQVWDSVVMLWMAAWIGWMPALALDALWTTPLCLLGVLTPDLYAGWRLRAHRAGRLRCDWICALDARSLPRGPDVRR